jgi:hypothetical protein
VWGGGQRGIIGNRVNKAVYELKADRGRTERESERKKSGKMFHKVDHPKGAYCTSLNQPEVTLN